MEKTYQGSCHCGAVRFECDLDLGAETLKCNCSFCSKSRFWKSFARAGAFRLLEGTDMLSDYQAASSEWPPGHVHHYFCRRCGVRGFSKGFLEQFGGDFHAVNIATVDDAVTDLANAPVRFENGREDDHESPPRETRHL